MALPAVAQQGGLTQGVTQQRVSISPGNCAPVPARWSDQRRAAGANLISAQEWKLNSSRDWAAPQNPSARSNAATNPEALGWAWGREPQPRAALLGPCYQWPVWKEPRADPSGQVCAWEHV